MNISPRSLALAGAISALSLAASACTPQDAATVNTAASVGINALCTAASIGSTIAIDVALPGSTGAKVGSLVQTVGGAECPAIVAGVQSLVAQATAAGQTAVVNAVVTAPSGAVSLRRRVMVSKVMRRATPGGAVTASYSFTVMPGNVGGLPSLSELTGGIL